MGWSNSVSIFQGHVTFILQDEIDIALPFLDDVPLLGSKTRYEPPDGTLETIPENPGIRDFVQEHFQDVNCIFHCIKHVGTWYSTLRPGAFSRCQPYFPLYKARGHHLFRSQTLDWNVRS